MHLKIERMIVLSNNSYNIAIVILTCSLLLLVEVIALKADSNKLSLLFPIAFKSLNQLYLYLIFFCKKSPIILRRHFLNNEKNFNLKNRYVIIEYQLLFLYSGPLVQVILSLLKTLFYPGRE